MASAHLAAIRAAERTTRELMLLINRLGTEAHPRGAILTAYRHLRRLLQGRVTDLALLRRALRELRRSVEDAVTRTLAESLELGFDQARRTLEAQALSVLVEPEPAVMRDWLLGVMAMVEQQARMAEVMTRTRNVTEAALLGDQTRMGLLSPTPVIREAARAATAVAVGGAMGVMARSGERVADRGEYREQAIATIDERTTDCCLRVHGQIKGLDEPFTLAGTPRFADEMMSSPFHWYCRTSIALVHRDDMEDDLTGQMREAAGKELAARREAQEQQARLEQQLAELGAQPDIRRRKGDSAKVSRLREELREWRERERVEIHPSNARSKRGEQE